MIAASADLHRSIFDEPPDTLSDDGLHYGHLLVATAGLEEIELARMFSVAGHRLLAAAQQEHETWEAASPILFCYRHALELYLKALVQPDRRGHGLAALWSALHDRINGQFRADHVTWLDARVREFHAVDPRSTSFRYHDAQPHNIDPELWVDFHHLGAQAHRLFGAMETIRLRLIINPRD